MYNDGSYHYNELEEELNIIIDNFLSDKKNITNEEIEKFSNENYLNFNPYFDKNDIINIINMKLNKV